MAITIPRTLRHPVNDAVWLRVLRDFDEMPTLCLTAAQAMRLWDLDQPTYEAAFGTLVEARLIEKDAQGLYRRAHN